MHYQPIQNLVISYVEMFSRKYLLNTIIKINKRIFVALAYLITFIIRNVVSIIYFNLLYSLLCNKHVNKIYNNFK